MWGVLFKGRVVGGDQCCVAMQQIAREGLQFPRFTPSPLAPALSLAGVMLFELCAGQALFAQDTNNDDIANKGDEKKLCLWLCITDKQLGLIFAADDASCSAQQRADARHLVRWCLQGDPAMRPTTAELLAHRFLNPADAGVGRGAPAKTTMEVPVRHQTLRPRIGKTLRVIANPRGGGRMRYHMFISHMQVVFRRPSCPPSPPERPSWIWICPPDSHP